VTALEGKPVVFIAVTDEDETTVMKFLETHPVAGRIGLIPNRDVWKQLGMEGIPAGFMVDPAGSIVARAHPKAMTKESVERVMRGEPAYISQVPFLKVTIEPPTAAGGDTLEFSDDDASFQGNMSLRELIAHAWGVHRSRVLGDFNGDEFYRVEFAVSPERHSALRIAMQHAIQDGLSLSIRKETRSLEGFVLEPAPGGPKLKPFTPGEALHGTLGDGNMQGTGLRFVDLLRQLEGFAGKPIFDQTGLKGQFDFDLQWKPGDLASLTESLREQMGLVLKPAKMPADVVIVTRSPALPGSP
jgi:uncharacterized protein (TIGR03435 family)